MTYTSCPPCPLVSVLVSAEHTQYVFSCPPPIFYIGADTRTRGRAVKMANYPYPTPMPVGALNTSKTTTCVVIRAPGFVKIAPIASLRASCYDYVNAYIRKHQGHKMRAKMDAKQAIQIQEHPNFDAIEQANLSPRTRAQYIKALNNCLRAGVNVSDAAQLGAYAIKLPRSSRSFLKAAIRLTTQGLASTLKGGATPENIAQVQAALMRLEAINETIKVSAEKGEKAHTWLSQAQVKQLMATCDDTETGRRDWVVLALLVGAGLRREELVRVRCEDIRDLPTRNGKTRWLLHTIGKGAKGRDIPISAVLAVRLRDWCKHIESGNVARSLGRRKELGEGLSEIAVFQIVRKHAAMIGKDGLDPHDLRRTYAQLGYEAGVPLTQLSKLLGHSDVATTQRYLNLDLDLETTVSDFIPLE